LLLLSLETTLLLSLVAALLLTLEAALLLSLVATLLSAVAALLLTSLVTASAASKATSASSESTSSAGLLTSWLTLSENHFSSIDRDVLGFLQSLLALLWGVEFNETESSWSASFSVGWDFDVGSVFERWDVEKIINGGVPRNVSRENGSGGFVFAVEIVHGHFVKVVF
jgi:hypothetical protein